MKAKYKLAALLLLTLLGVWMLMRPAGPPSVAGKAQDAPPAVAEDLGKTTDHPVNHQNEVPRKGGDPVAPPAIFGKIDTGWDSNMVIALDEAMLRLPEGKDVPLKIDPPATLATLEDRIGEIAKGRNVVPVCYPAGAERDPYSRALITRNIRLKLSDRSVTPELPRSVKILTRPDYAPDYMVVSASDSFEAIARLNELRKITGVQEANLSLARQMKLNSLPNDPYFADQWHLLNQGQAGVASGTDVNIVGAWLYGSTGGVTGAGVTIGIVDDGLETAHPDLLENTGDPDLDQNIHWDWNGNDNDPNPNPFSPDQSELNSNHGTACAGNAAAKGNNLIGVTGTAPNARLVGMRLVAGSIEDWQFAAAINYRNSEIHIQSNSWGSNTHFSYYKLEPLSRAALTNATLYGRNNRGTIFVRAAGNDVYRVGDNVNYDELKNSIYMLPIGATNSAGGPAFYSYPGASLVVSAPSGINTGKNPAFDDPNTPNITTTDRSGLMGYNGAASPADYLDKNYTRTFKGTSSSCPTVAGIIALMLEKNPNLGWRDVKEILIKTASKDRLTDPYWATNQAGYHFNHKFGAGLVDATAAVNQAATWTNLAPMTSASRIAQNLPASIPDNDTAGVQRTFDFTGSNIRVEHAELNLTFTHPNRGDLSVTLTSPSGMVSTLAEMHSGDGSVSNFSWTFSSVRHWGESSENTAAGGVWTLRVADQSATSGSGQLSGATLNLYGTPISPALSVTGNHLTASGPTYGPFTPASTTYTITNNGSTRASWTAAEGALWLDLSSSSGILEPGQSTTLTASINSVANTLPAARYRENITVTGPGGSQTFPVTLDVGYLGDGSSGFTWQANIQPNGNGSYTGTAVITGYSGSGATVPVPQWVTDSITVTNPTTGQPETHWVNCRVTGFSGFSLCSDASWSGDVNITGSFALNGYDLTISGHVIHQAGNLAFTGGQLEVTGDYLEQWDADGDGTFETAGYGHITMVNSSDLMLVHGDAIFVSYEFSQITSGTIEVKGNFKGGGYGVDGSGLASFHARDSNVFRLSGLGAQIITSDYPVFRSGPETRIELSNLEITNTNLVDFHCSIFLERKWSSSTGNLQIASGNRIIQSVLTPCEFAIAGNTTIHGFASDYPYVGGLYGGMKKTGNGSLIWDLAMGYNFGASSIDGGTFILKFPSILAILGENLFSVNSGGTLGGNGTIIGAITVNSGGTLSPGMSEIATLQVNGALTLAAGSITVMQISKSGGHLSSDSIAGLTGVTFGGTLQVALQGDAPTAGDRFFLFARTSGFYLGSFASVTLPALPANLKWDISGLATDGSIGVVSSTTTDAPTFSPAGGVCYSAQTVTISSTPGSTIFYTTDGTDPLTSASVISGASPVTVTTNYPGSAVLKAYAMMAGANPSAVAVANFIEGTRSWINPSGGSFPVAGNWLGGSIPGGTGVFADFATLDLTADTAVTLDGARTIGGMRFGDTTPSHNWTMNTGSGGPLTLAVTSGVPIVDVVNQTTTINATLAGTHGLSKAGSGTLVLSGSGTWTGATTVSAGTLEVLSKSGDVDYTVNQGATLKLGYNSGGGYSKSVVVNGNGVADAAGLYLKRGITYQTNNGLLLQTAPTTVRAYGTGPNPTIRGFDVNYAHFIKTAAAASGSEVAADVNVNTGTYGYKVAADPGANTTTGDLVIRGIISGTGNAKISSAAIFSGLYKVGTGSLKLTNANTFSSGVSILSGAIILSGGSDRLPVGAALSLGSGTGSGKLVLGDSSGAVGQTLTSIGVNGTGTSNAIVGGGSSPSTLTVNLTADAVYSGKIGGTAANENSLNLAKTGAAVLTLNGANSFTGTTTIHGGTLAVDGNQVKNRLCNNHSVRINSGGVFEIRGVNALPNSTNAVDVTVNSGGMLTVVSGTSAYGGSQSHAHLRNLTLSGGTVGLVYAGTGTAYSGESFQLNGNVTVNGSSASSIQGTGTTATTGVALSGNNIFTINDVTNNADADLVVSVELENKDSGANGLIKDGTGSMALTGTNTYTGDTTVTGGTLSLGGSAIADTNKLIVSGGKVDLPTGVTETVGTLFFGAVQQVRGTWGSSQSAALHKDDARFSGTGVLVVESGPAAYTEWAAANASGESVENDHDHDGVPNGIEYFMGASANGFTANPVIVNGTVTWPKSADFAGAFAVQTSTDMKVWTDVTSDPAQVTISPSSVIWTRPAVPGNRFVRLLVMPNQLSHQ